MQYVGWKLLAGLDLIHADTAKARTKTFWYTESKLPDRVDLGGFIV